MSLYLAHLYWDRRRHDRTVMLWFFLAIFGIVSNAFGCFVVIHRSEWIPEAEVRPMPDMEDIVVSNFSMYGDVGLPSFQSSNFVVAKEPDFSLPFLPDFPFRLHSPGVEVGKVAGKQVSNLGPKERQDVGFAKIRGFTFGHNLNISRGDNILCRGFTDIIHANGDSKNSAGDSLEFPVSMKFNHRTRFTFRGFARGDKGIYRDIGSFFIGAVNEQGKSDIDKQQKGRYFRPKQLFFIVGCAVFLSGCVLLSKVLNKVYLDAGFNVNMAFGGFVAAAVMFWFGGWIIVHTLGLS